MDRLVIGPGTRATIDLGLIKDPTGEVVVCDPLVFMIGIEDLDDQDR